MINYLNFLTGKNFEKSTTIMIDQVLEISETTNIIQLKKYPFISLTDLNSIFIFYNVLSIFVTYN